MLNANLVAFLFEVILVIMTVGLAVAIGGLCTMLVRSIYRDWDKL